MATSLFSPVHGIADGSELEWAVKSAYVYNFIQFIEWPEPDPATAKSPIVICMIGNDSLSKALSELSSRQLQGRPIRVDREPTDTGVLTGCRVVVIGRSAADRLPSLLKQYALPNVLTVGDIPQFAEKGGGIGFVIVNGRVKIEINLNVVQQAGLKVRAKLLEVARIIP